MKKVLAIVIVLLMLVGCAKTEKAKGQSFVSRFMTVETTISWRVVVDRETRVLYTVSLGTNNIGVFTVLVDADGKPLLWEGELE